MPSNHPDSQLMIQHASAEVNGLELHYAYAGSGPLMIFLHGFPAYWYVWHRQLQQFGATHLAVAPDGRGINLSAKPVDLAAYQIDQLAADVIGLADHLAHQTFTLVGHDWGGAVAWQVAQMYPERVAKLIVINAPPYDALLYALATIPAQRQASAYIERIRDEGREAYFLANDCEALWRIAFAELVKTGMYGATERAYFTEAWQRAGAMTGALNWYRANIPALDDIVAEQHAPQLDKAIVVPSLLLWSEHEKAFLPELRELIPAYVARLKIVPVAQAGHWANLEQPEVIYREIVDFMAA